MTEIRRRIAVLCAPWRDRTDTDAGELRHAKAALIVRAWVPLFLPDTLDEVLSDSDDTERMVALNVSADFCKTMAEVPGAIMVVVGEQMTEGMRLDVEAWLDAGGPAPVKLELVAHAFDVHLKQERENDGRDD